MTLNLFVGQCDWLRVQEERGVRNSRRGLRIHNIALVWISLLFVGFEDGTTKRKTFSFATAW
jgi:hypothetical protein